MRIRLNSMICSLTSMRLSRRKSTKNGVLKLASNVTLKLVTEAVALVTGKVMKMAMVIE